MGGVATARLPGLLAAALALHISAIDVILRMRIMPTTADVIHCCLRAETKSAISGKERFASCQFHSATLLSFDDGTMSTV